MAAANDTIKFSIKVPTDRPDDKADTKVVKRILVSLKGKSPKRTAIVLWRGEHLTVSENTEKSGHFIAGKAAKKADVPETAPKKATVSKAAEKPAPKKAAKKATPKGKKTAKESDTRAGKRAA